MKHFEHEEPITASENNKIVLTSRRIRQTENGADFTSIMLEKISSIEVRYQSWFVLFIAGIILMGGGLLYATKNNVSGMYAVAIGVVCIIIYLVTRKHIVSISSDGGARIVFATSGMSKEQVLEFADKVEEAKSKLISSL